MNAQKVDVLALMRVIQTASTGSIASRARFRPREYDGKLVLHKSPTTAAVLRAMRAEERAGHVRCIGTHAQLHPDSWRCSAAGAKELYWTVTDAGRAALANVGSAP